MDTSKLEDGGMDAETELSNTGRWTKAEHELFLRGLQEFGKDWKQIGSLIKTRTVVQIRTHAQKYFLANKKNDDGSMPLVNIPAKVTAASKKRLAANSAAAKNNKAKKKKDAEAESNNLDGLDKIFDLVDAWSSGSDEGTPTSLDELDFLRGSGLPSFPQREPGADEARSSVVEPTPISLDDEAAADVEQEQILDLTPLEVPTRSPARQGGKCHDTHSSEHHMQQQHLQTYVHYQHQSVQQPQQQPLYSYQPSAHQLHNYQDSTLARNSATAAFSRSTISSSASSSSQANSVPSLDLPLNTDMPAPEVHELANSFDPLPPSLEHMFLGRWIDAMSE